MTELSKIYFHLKYKGIHKDKYIVSFNYIGKGGTVEYCNSSWKESQTYGELFFIGLNSPKNLFDEIEVHDFGYFDIVHEGNQSTVTCVKDSSAENIFYDKTTWEHPTDQDLEEGVPGVTEYESDWLFKLYTTICQTELHRCVQMSADEKCKVLGIPNQQEYRDNEIGNLLDET